MANELLCDKLVHIRDLATELLFASEAGSERISQEIKNAVSDIMKMQFVKISDNRQSWLIGMGEDYARAFRAERAAWAAWQEAKAKREESEKNLARIGGYIIDERERRQEGAGK